MATPTTNPRRGTAASPFALDVDYSSAPALARLPPGRHGLPPEFVALNHRNRLLAGAIDSLGERGYLATTVADITKAAAVSRRTFYDHFADKEACFLLAYDVTVGWIEAEVGAATEAAEGWPQSVSAAVGTVLALFAADPRLARLCTVEVFLAGEAAAQRQEALIDRLCRALAGGRAEQRSGAELPTLLEQTLIGGAISLIPRHLQAGRAERLAELAPDISYFLLVPYLGVDEARRAATASPELTTRLFVPVRSDSDAVR